MSIAKLVSKFPGINLLEGAEKVFFTDLLLGQLDCLRPPATPGGYDYNHVAEMTGLYDKFTKSVPRTAVVTRFVYMVTVLLHNTDRPDALKAQLGIPSEGWKKRWEEYLRERLADFPGDGSKREEIIYAILQHSKRDDAPEDPILLTMLRVADKIVRFGALGIKGQAANRGRTAMFYNPVNPYQYADPGVDLAKIEDGMNVAVDELRVTEWTGMIPEFMMAMMPWHKVARTVQIIRWTGAEIAEQLGIEDRTEDCLRKALGVHYARFSQVSGI